MPSVTTGIRISVTFQAIPLRDGARFIVAEVVFIISSEPKPPVTAEDTLSMRKTVDAQRSAFAVAENASRLRRIVHRAKARLADRRNWQLQQMRADRQAPGGECRRTHSDWRCVRRWNRRLKSCGTLRANNLRGTSTRCRALVLEAAPCAPPESVVSLCGA